jgi:hypothetical protein
MKLTLKGFAGHFRSPWTLPKIKTGCEGRGDGTVDAGGIGEDSMIEGEANYSRVLVSDRCCGR